MTAGNVLVDTKPFSNARKILASASSGDSSIAGADQSDRPPYAGTRAGRVPLATRPS
jgi:hypothetical protein